jgi:hypothetical protein
MGRIYLIKEKESPFKDTYDFLKKKLEETDDEQFSLFANQFLDLYKSQYETFEVECTLVTEGETFHHSGLIATKEILQLLKTEYDKMVAEKMCYGELNYTSDVEHEKYKSPIGYLVTLSKVTHLVTSIEIGEDKFAEGRMALNAKITILNTPEGKVIKELIKKGMFQKNASVQLRLEPVFELAEPTTNIQEIPLKTITPIAIDFLMYIG